MLYVDVFLEEKPNAVEDAVQYHLESTVLVNRSAEVIEDEEIDIQTVNGRMVYLSGLYNPIKQVSMAERVAFVQIGTYLYQIGYLAPESDYKRFLPFYEHMIESFRFK